MLGATGFQLIAIKPNQAWRLGLGDADMGALRNTGELAAKLQFKQPRDAGGMLDSNMLAAEHKASRSRNSWV